MAGRLTGRNSEANWTQRRDKRIAALTGANIDQKKAAAEAARRGSRANMLQAENQVLLQELQNKGQTDVQGMREKGLGERLLADQTFGAEQAGQQREFKREQENVDLAGKGLLAGAFTGPEAQGVANSGAYVPNLAEITTKNKGGYQYIKPVFEESYSPETGRFEKMPVTSGKVFNPATGEVAEQAKPGGNTRLQNLIKELYGAGELDEKTAVHILQNLGME